MKTSETSIISEGNVFIDLRIDYAFALIFGKHGNEDLLLRLVNAILPHLGITSVSLANQGEVGPRPDNRKAVLDVHCTTSTGEEILIEMQYARQRDFGSRLVFYSTFPIQNGVRRGRKGAGAYMFQDIYVIGITDFVLEQTKALDEPINYYSVANRKHSEITLADNLQYVTVELPKLRLEQAQSPVDLILYGIRDIGSMKKMPKAYRDAGLEKLFELCKFAALEKKEQMEYLHEYMKKLTEESVLYTARLEGTEQGFAEGLEKGRAEAMSEAAAAVSAEKERIIAVLKAQGVSEDIIAKVL